MLDLTNDSSVAVHLNLLRFSLGFESQPELLLVAKIAKTEPVEYISQ